MSLSTEQIQLILFMHFNVNLPLFILSLLISVVQMQRWAGTFAWNNQCKSNYCCCYAGKLSVVSSGSNLIFSSDTKGCGSPRSSTTFPNPNSHSFSATGTRGAQITYRLSSDSNTITVQNNVYGYCGGSASRTSTGNKHIYPSTLFLLIILASRWMLL